MAYAYPIWNEVQNCTYKSSKSYGNKETGKVDILVGSDSRNSFNLATHITTKRVKGPYTFRGKTYDKVVVFKFSVEDIILKEMIFEYNNGKAGKLIKERSALTRMKGL